MIKQYYITCDASCPSACGLACLALSGQQAVNIFSTATGYCPRKKDGEASPSLTIISANELGGSTACTRDVEADFLLRSIHAAYYDMRAIDCQRSSAYNKLYEVLEQLLARGEPVDISFTGGAE